MNHRSIYSCSLSQTAINIAGIGVGLVGTLLYILTIEPSISFWDCGEFVSTSYGLQVGHPPGAPFYTLLAHIFMLFATGNSVNRALCSNMFSAVSGGTMCMFFFWTIVRMLRWQHVSSTTRDSDTPTSIRNTSTTYSFDSLLGGLVGALVCMVCDTIWFSAVESEVYSLAALLSVVLLWSAVRWNDSDQAVRCRWLFLGSLLCSLSISVHIQALLVLPACLCIFVFKLLEQKRKGEIYKMKNHFIRISLTCAFFFLLGLTPQLITPIRANANTPINEGNPSTVARWHDYIDRNQYEKAPLYPRMWRTRQNDVLRYSQWNGHIGKPTAIDEARFFCSYQLGYMYLRYFMWNFSGRFNHSQGLSSLQNGQFITGIPVVDKLLVGSGEVPPKTISHNERQVYFMLPLVLGLIGFINCYNKNKKVWWTCFIFFLTTGPLLSVYLNHPLFEPRERDYAYALSFIAYCIFIANGVYGLCIVCKNKKNRLVQLVPILAIGVPVLMVVQNYPSHNRSHRMTAHDIALNTLNSCASNGILFSVGDNDTFPLWAMQQVEAQRCDVALININLLATDWYRDQVRGQLARQSMNILPNEEDCVSLKHVVADMLANNIIVDTVSGISSYARPVYFTPYALDLVKDWIDSNFIMIGSIYQHSAMPCESIDVQTFYNNIMRSQWHDMRYVHNGYTEVYFLELYWKNVINLVAKLQQLGSVKACEEVLDKTLNDIPLSELWDIALVHDIYVCYSRLNAKEKAESIKSFLCGRAELEHTYYSAFAQEDINRLAHVVSPLLAVEQSLADNRDTLFTTAHCR